MILSLFSTDFRWGNLSWIWSSYERCREKEKVYRFWKCPTVLSFSGDAQGLSNAAGFLTYTTPKSAASFTTVKQVLSRKTQNVQKHHKTHPFVAAACASKFLSLSIDSSFVVCRKLFLSGLRGHQNGIHAVKTSREIDARRDATAIRPQRRKSALTDWSNCCFPWKMEWNVQPALPVIELFPFCSLASLVSDSQGLFPGNLYLWSNTFRCKSNL